MSQGVMGVAERALIFFFFFFWGGGESETRMTASVLKQDPKLF